MKTVLVAVLGTLIGCGLLFVLALVGDSYSCPEPLASSFSSTMVRP